MQIFPKHLLIRNQGIILILTLRIQNIQLLSSNFLNLSMLLPK